MKLNQYQKTALALWLGSKINNLWNDGSVIQSFDEFCDEKFMEWRIMCNWGMAGKIWNVNDRIYVTGWCSQEIGNAEWKKQQKIVDEWNRELEDLIAYYS